MVAIAAAIVAATAAGVGAHRRFGASAERLSKRLLAAMLYVLIPPVVFFNLVRLELTADVGIGLALAWPAVIASGVIAYFASTRVLALDRPQAGALINAVLHPNTAYLGLPFCAAALGTDTLDEAVAYDTLVGVPTLLIGVFGVGAVFGTESGESARARALAFLTRNPPLIAAIAGLVAPAALAPDALVDASRVLVFALLPLGFFALGVTLAGERTTAAPRAEVAVALALRLAVAPALLLVLAAPFIDLPDAYLLLAAMPTGLGGLVVAHAYGLDVGLAARAIAYGTAIVVAVALAVTLAT